MRLVSFTKAGRLVISCKMSTVSFFMRRKLYWFSWHRGKHSIEFTWGVDHQCKCKEISFVPCPECGARC